jgi:signal transduction histidine kinase
VATLKQLEAMAIALRWMMIKKNITNKLFIQMGAIILGFSAMLLLANVLLIQPLYYNAIKNSMVTVAESLKEVDILVGSENWAKAIEEIDSKYDYDIIIEGNNVILYSSIIESSLENSEYDLDERLKQNILSANLGNDIGNAMRSTNDAIGSIKAYSDWDLYGEDIYIGIMAGVEQNREIMVGKSTLSEHTTVYLSKPLETVNIYMQQSNRLLFAVTFIFFCISMIMAYKMSIQFTKPIKQIQKQVNYLTQLDFENKLSLETGDELEELGNDINHLSNKLEESLELLKQQNHQLEKDILSQRKLLSNVSHELRTPLSLIKGYSDEVAAGFITDSQQQRLIIEYISEESKKMSRLINEILELSQLESGRMSFINGKYNIAESITGFLEKYDGYVSNHNLKVTLDIHPQVEGIFDPVRFEQILANFISNASKYCDEKREIKIYTTIQEENIRLHVYNSGNPIAKDVIEHIWDGFYKADEARTTDTESFGLGLSVVKAIQDLLKQDFGVFNEKSGVVFWFDVKRFWE